MPSPFPGMDPYLEGYLWSDFHAALAHKIRQLLAPQIQPKYVARLEISVIEDESFEAEIGVMYPDKDVVLDLPVALTGVYDEAFYHLSIDYQQPPPPPPLSAEAQQWMRQLLSPPTSN